MRTALFGLFLAAAVTIVAGDDYASQGGSPLGTFNTADNRQQWGDYNVDTDYNFIVPDTGVIREVCLQAG